MRTAKKNIRVCQHPARENIPSIAASELPDKEMDNDDGEAYVSKKNNKGVYKWYKKRKRSSPKTKTYEEKKIVVPAGDGDEYTRTAKPGMKLNDIRLPASPEALCEVDFSNTDLTDSDLSGSNFFKCNFKNVNMKNANVDKSQFTCSDFRGAVNLTQAQKKILRATGAILTNDDDETMKLEEEEFQETKKIVTDMQKFIIKLRFGRLAGEGFRFYPDAEKWNDLYRNK